MNIEMRTEIVGKIVQSDTAADAERQVKEENNKALVNSTEYNTFNLTEKFDDLGLIIMSGVTDSVTKENKRANEQVEEALNSQEESKEDEGPRKVVESMDDVFS